jgi:2-keto-4-pentenoate hydratase
MKEECCITVCSIPFYHMELQYGDIVLRHSLKKFYSPKEGSNIHCRFKTLGIVQT